MNAVERGEHEERDFKTGPRGNPGFNSGKVYTPKNTEIETFSGRFVDITDPDPATIALEDIAHGIALTCRFSGQCFNFYSVAEHAVLAARYAKHEGWNVVTQLACLHHDDAEGYLTDLPRPIKEYIGSDRYKELTALVDEALVVSLQLPFGADAFHSEQVREADNFALMAEARELLPSQGRGWGGQAVNWDLELETKDGPDLHDWAFSLNPRAAEALWLRTHRDLMKELG